MGLCAKPGCARPGAALLSYDYSARRASLEDARRYSPHEYLLCLPCAERLTPPVGWSLEDRRAEPPLFAPQDQTIVLDPDAPAPPQELESAPARQLFFGESA